MGKVICKRQDIAGKVSILTDRRSGDTTFELNENIAWRLYRGNTVDTIDISTPIASGSGAGKYKLDLPVDNRSYFSLQTDHGNLILAGRRLPLEGSYNFRDLGGYRTKTGRYVKWGRIFRSDDLGGLTGADLDYLSRVPIVSVVDFRSPQEVSMQADKLPVSVKHSYPYSIVPGDLMKMAGNGILSLEEVEGLMQQLNKELVTDADAVGKFRELFALLQDDANMPLVYHCTAGKDRTGMASALILFSLGVDDCTVIADYLLSNRYLKGKYDVYIKQNPAIEPLLEVRETYIRAGLQQIERSYGSVDKFLRETLGVDVKLMKEMYLYK